MKKIIVVALLSLVGLLSACAEDFDNSAIINVYTRDTESGTREAFFSGIGFGDAAEDDSLLVSNKTVVSGNSDMIAKLLADEYSLGYISLSSLAGSGLIGLSYEGVVASESNVLNNSYLLKRPFNYIQRVSNDYPSTDVEAIVNALIAYMGTQEGKAIIIENGGIVELSSSDVRWADISGSYDVCAKDNSGVDIYIGGSTSVEKIAKALSADFKGKCGDFNPLHNHSGSSAAYKGTQHAEYKDSAATYLDLGFTSRAFKSEEVGADRTYGEICWDAVVAVVNSENILITNISTQQLKNIYDGSITNWNNIIND
ncbi:MAG: substrate-binding domain-containing protein [Candidatus Izemoplasma sp.]